MSKISIDESGLSDVQLKQIQGFPVVLFRNYAMKKKIILLIGTGITFPWSIRKKLESF